MQFHSTDTIPCKIIAVVVWTVNSRVRNKQSALACCLTPSYKGLILNASQSNHFSSTAETGEGYDWRNIAFENLRMPFNQMSRCRCIFCNYDVNDIRERMLVFDISGIPLGHKAHESEQKLASCLTSGWGSLNFITAYWCIAVFTFCF